MNDAHVENKKYPRGDVLFLKKVHSWEGITVLFLKKVHSWEGITEMVLGSFLLVL